MPVCLFHGLVNKKLFSYSWHVSFPVRMDANTRAFAIPLQAEPMCSSRQSRIKVSTLVLALKQWEQSSPLLCLSHVYIEDILFQDILT